MHYTFICESAIQTMESIVKEIRQELLMVRFAVFVDSTRKGPILRKICAREGRSFGYPVGPRMNGSQIKT